MILTTDGRQLIPSFLSLWLSATASLYLEALDKLDSGLRRQNWSSDGGFSNFFVEKKDPSLSSGMGGFLVEP